MKMITQIQYHVVFHVDHGAYLLFQTEKDDPNKKLKLMRDPQYPTVHLGYNSTAEGDNGFFTVDRDNTKLKDRNCNELKLEKGWKICKNIRQILSR